MSDLDDQDSQSQGRLYLESNNPHYSLVNSTINLTLLDNRGEDEDDESLETTHRRYSPTSCFNTTTNLSADQNAIKRRIITDKNISGQAPNTGMPVCYAPPVEAGPRDNGGEFLEPPILTTSQRSNPWSPFQCGEIEVKGARMSTVRE